MAFKGSKFAGLMQYPDRTNKRRGGAKKGLICSYLRGLYIQTIKAGLFQYSKGIKGAKVRRVSVQTQTAGAKALQRRRGGGTEPKRQGQGSLQKNLGTKSTKPFPLPKSFGSQKIFRKNFGKMKKGFVSKGRIFGGSGKNLSGVILFDCIFWSDLLGKWFGLG